MNQDNLAQIFKALSDPTRLKIIALLSNKKLVCDCSSNLLSHLDISQPTLSYHMKMLIDAGVVWETKAGNFRRYQVNEDWKSAIANFIKST